MIAHPQARFSRADAALVLAAALLETVAARLVPSAPAKAGLPSAVAVFKNTAVVGVDEAVRRACPCHEWLQVRGLGSSS